MLGKLTEVKLKKGKLNFSFAEGGKEGKSKRIALKFFFESMFRVCATPKELVSQTMLKN